MKPQGKRCAVYTRKSSEEGLEQDFNSLDAQREACLSYIASQKAEGWTATKGRYDDGGFSGGTMERPGLKQLLVDIEAGEIDIVVVYKIDRLTRSLMDFAKLVEIFDRRGVTFVSVTQSFNTTTSMGRLTLNVLLSFAQFEREVTGERIRDKIAASKKKGMWMGGTRPTGYNAEDHQLTVNEDEAKLVRMIFEKYLELGCVRRLKDWLDKNKIRTKVWTSAKGIQHGGASFSRGILYKILTNPVYIGKIRHKDKIFDGNHPPIIQQELWEQVQAQLSQGSPSGRGKKKSPLEGSLLKGLMFDYRGDLYTPTYTKKDGKEYRYYIHQAKMQDRPVPADIVERMPAHDMETLVADTLKDNLSSPEKIAHLLSLDAQRDQGTIALILEKVNCLQIRAMIPAAVHKVIVHPGTISVLVRSQALRERLREGLKIALDDVIPDTMSEIRTPFEPARSRRGFTIPSPVKRGILDLPQAELKNLVRGLAWRDAHFRGENLKKIAQREKVSKAFVGILIRETFDLGQ